MLVSRQAGRLEVIGQASHAWLSGQLARAWGNDAFRAPVPREEVCLAAEQHDVGMTDWDRAPRLDDDGAGPVPFTRMTLPEHLGLWSRAPRRLVSQSHYAALLVSLHGCSLYERRDASRMSASDREAVTGYLRREREWQAAVVARLGADTTELERNRRLLWAWDGLSLALCLGWAGHVAEDVPTRDEAGVSMRLEPRGEPGDAPPEWTLAPWPFAAADVVVRCEARRLRPGFTGPRALESALAAARPYLREFRLAPR